MPQSGFTPIQLYRSATASSQPNPSDLQDGELALNTNDGKLFYKNSSGNLATLASTAGATGDVTGPGVAVDSALVAMSGTTGKVIKSADLTLHNVILGNGTNAPQVVAPGANGNVLKSNGTTWTSTTEAAIPQLVGTNTTATSDQFLVASAGSITITLPSSPTAGDFVIVKDGTGAAATTNFTVNGGGSNIASSGTPLTFDKNFAQITMTYMDATIGWSV